MLAVWLLQASSWSHSEKREKEGTSDYRNQGPRASSNPELGEYKESAGLVLGFFVFLSAVSAGFP